jgi:hypothetical protein
MNRVIFIFIVSCYFGFIQIAQAENDNTKAAAIDTLQPTSHGIISAVDIQDKTIQIGERTFGIIDGVQVYSKNHELINQLALAPGQQIEFSLSPQPLDKAKNSPLPDQVVTTVRILSGFKENAIPR